MIEIEFHINVPIWLSKIIYMCQGKCARCGKEFEKRGYDDELVCWTCWDKDFAKDLKWLKKLKV